MVPADNTKPQRSRKGLGTTLQPLVCGRLSETVSLFGQHVHDDGIGAEPPEDINRREAASSFEKLETTRLIYNLGCDWRNTGCNFDGLAAKSKSRSELKQPITAKC